MGGAGTIYKKAAAQTNGDLIINNNDQDNADDRYIGKTLVNEVITFDTITIQNYGNLETGSASNIIYSTLDWSSKGIIIDNGGMFSIVSGGGSLMIPAASKLAGNTARTFTGLTVNGTLTHTNNTIAETYKLDYVINGDLLIAESGAIAVQEKGYQAETGPGAGGGGYVVGGGGAGYGGGGGVGAYSSGTGGPSYGSITEPSNIGSGGGNPHASTGGFGGGAVKLAVTGITTIAGSVNADGKNSPNKGGAGSGGSVWIETGTLLGAGAITANGGAG
ncbi:MAG: hypothetical protein KAI25_03735, partial [Hyphomicrobiaceae bacterium]|nr:hypothetical protein [Hyphomicrobiaceae bacterium]